MTSGSPASGNQAGIDARISEHPILAFPKGRQVTFTFEGQEVLGFEGEPIAAALLAANIRAFRHSTNLARPRGLFCAIGNCSSCLMQVDGRPNVRICVEQLREGMDVRIQAGKGQLGAGR